MKKCSICENADGIYKCPVCLVYYCSVACCKKHRELKCDIAKPVENTETAIKDEATAQKLITSDTVPVEKLKLLRESSELKNVLANPHLRNLLKAVDSCSDPDKVMQKVMLEPIFVEFADECLKIIEPESNRENTY
ncbi:zinc finger HIT domain-containing protein 3 [Agrilus planipennis]|uniref:Zinc finger HIT domain-containing protein 3 n=1 Tax=Agrilus planipennis TaxID=224129 RepID=A0A7F5RKH2_AGRPL|nr:zinc finger HIT domain-containing protein 3 [Agrilus planipennis]